MIVLNVICIDYQMLPIPNYFCKINFHWSNLSIKNITSTSSVCITLLYTYAVSGRCLWFQIVAVDVDSKLMNFKNKHNENIMFINKGIYCRIYMYILKSRIANKEKELFQDIAMNACFELFFLWYSSLWCTLEKVLYFIYIKDFIWLWYFCDAKELYANVNSRIH